MKRSILYRQVSGSRAESAVFAGLSFVALLSVLFGVVTMTDFVRNKDNIVACYTGSGPNVPTLTTARYFSTGQWLADMRTLVAMGRWMIEPSGKMKHNESPVPAQSAPGSGPTVASPTKTASGTPKA